MYFNNFRFNLQHRAFYCYVLLSLWICILLGGLSNTSISNSNRSFHQLYLLSFLVSLSVMYTYVGIEGNAASLLKNQTTEINIMDEINIFRVQKLAGSLIKAKKITKFCNIYKDIRPGAEGNDELNTYSLFLIP